MRSRSSFARLSTLMAGLAGALALSLCTAPAALAHNTLIESSPKDGATLDTAPEEVVLTFNAEVMEGGNGIVVTGPEGGTYEDGTVSLDAEQASIGLEPLTAAGEYTIDYRIISADGHSLENTLSFTLTEDALPEASGSPQATESSPAQSPAASPAASPAGAQSPEESGALSMSTIIGIALAVAVAVMIIILLVRFTRQSKRLDE